MSPINRFGQPIGSDLSDWSAPPIPPSKVLLGRWCSVEPLDVDRDGEQLYEIFVTESEPQNWTYLAYGPFADRASFISWLSEIENNVDPMFVVVRDSQSGFVGGLASYLRIAAQAGTIEVGHIHLSDRLKQTTLATEAMYLMMRNAFQLGYRRYEWKCDALNAASRRAAERLGFRFEGIFRHATVYKQRNRDTAWYSIIDHEWPTIESNFDRWLAPENFDSEGRQRISLSKLMRQFRTS